MNKRLHAIFTGRVIGVGFRFTTMEIAHQSGNITGWVRNTPQGDVELIAEGEENELKEFLDSIQKKFEKNLSGTNMIWEQPTGEFKNFKMWDGIIRD